MRPIHDQHRHREPRLIVLQSPSPSTPLLDLLECLVIPLAFALLFFGWPVVTHVQPPWWALVGLLLYGGLGAWAIGVRLRASKPTPGEPNSRH